MDGSDPEITLDGAGRKLIHDYFRRAKVVDIIWPSASAVPVNVLQEVGGFAEGLRIGCDRDLWDESPRDIPWHTDNRILAVYHKEAMGRVREITLMPFRFRRLSAR